MIGEFYVCFFSYVIATKKCMLITQDARLLPHAIHVTSFKEYEIQSGLLMVDFLGSDRNPSVP